MQFLLPLCPDDFYFLIYSMHMNQDIKQKHVDASEEALARRRHSLAHLLAMAVLKKDPKAKLAIGPFIENGFYYDFEFSAYTPSPEDFPDLEKLMRDFIAQNLTFKKKEITEAEARELFKDQPYKLELIDEIIKNNEPLTVYQSGDFVDLCEGSHVENTKEIDPNAFTLSRTAGAYWRGDEKNTMLTRIYGLAFNTKEELDAYIQKQEEMKERDHRKIGKEMGLWVFSDLVGAGLPLYTPKGTALRTALNERLLEISKHYGALPVTIPHMAKRKLYEISGHAEKFGDELMEVKSRHDEFVLKPVNCPHHTQIYASEPRSYRDLPLHYMESTAQHRDEKPGEIGGLTRTRSFTVDDGHIFCRIDQVEEEAGKIAGIIEEFYASLGMWGSHWVSLSVRDPKAPEKYIGDEEGWREAEQMLQKVSDDRGLNAKRMEGEAALYGPKLDFMFTDALGRERQLATIQIDFAMPKRFGLEYTDSDGSKKTPVMIHRAILGSYERFMAILIEHFAGAFPLWLSPVQIKVLPIGEAHREYAERVFAKLKQAGIRVELDESDETLGKKIRQAKTEKVPYFLVIGDKEKENRTVTLESRDHGTIGAMTAQDTLARLKEEIDTRH